MRFNRRKYINSELAFLRARPYLFLFVSSPWWFYLFVGCCCFFFFWGGASGFFMGIEGREWEMPCPGTELFVFPKYISPTWEPQDWSKLLALMLVRKFYSVPSETPPSGRWGLFQRSKLEDMRLHRMKGPQYLLQPGNPLFQSARWLLRTSVLKVILINDVEWGNK